MDSPKRQTLCRATLNGFGVQCVGKALTVRASTENFALRKHNLLQAMLAINDAFYLASPTLASLFLEDVVDWFELADIRFTPNVKFTGKSGYDHRFDFVIPKSKFHPERILRTINRANRETAQSMAFSWIDTREVRSESTRAYALLNDSEQPIGTGVLDAMQNYGIRPIAWSEREVARAGPHRDI